MNKNNWYNKYYEKKIIDNVKYKEYDKYFGNIKKINLKKTIESIENNNKIKIEEIKKNYNNDNYINSINDLTSLELIQIELDIIKVLSKYCLENNLLDYNFFINTLKLLENISNKLKNNLNQPAIFHNDTDINDGIPRCSYKFCHFKSSCVYNYNNNNKKLICYQDHYVHNMISADINILVKYIKKYNNNDKISHNKEILKSINTLCYVINHMESELKEKCLYIDKSEWNKYHITKKVITKIVKA
jgi:hypothetical protein